MKLFFKIAFLQALHFSFFVGFAFGRSDQKYFLDDLNDKVDQLIQRINKLDSFRFDQQDLGKFPDVGQAPSEFSNIEDNLDAKSPETVLIRESQSSPINDLEPRIDKLLERLNLLEHAKQNTHYLDKEDYFESSIFPESKFENEKTKLNVFSDEQNPTNTSKELSTKVEVPLTSKEVDKVPSQLEEFNEKIIEPFTNGLHGNRNEGERKSEINEWDLLVLRELALINSPSILVKKAELNVLKEAMPIFEFQYFPTLTARAGIDNYAKIAQFQTYSEPQPYSVFSYGLDAKWILYDGFKTRKKINTAKSELTKAQQNLILEEQRILLKLIQHYFEVLHSDIELNFLPKIEEIKDLRSTIYSRQLQAGIINRMYIDTINRELENLQIQKMNAELTRDIAISEMSFILNVSEDFWSVQNLFGIPPELNVVESLDNENSIYGAVGDAGIALAESKFSEIETESSPNVSLSGSTGYRGRNRVGFHSQGYEINVGLKVELPISGHFLTRKKLIKARKEILRSEIEKRHLIGQHQNKFSAEKLKLELAYKNMKFHAELLNLQKKKLESVRIVSAQGISDKSSILLEQEELLTREMLLRQSELTCLKQKYILDLIQ